MPDPVITYWAIQANGASAAGIHERLAALCRAGVEIPAQRSDTALPLSVILHAGGVAMALDAVFFSQVDAPWVRHFACDCAERSLLRAGANGRKPDPRSWRAVEVSRAYARGEANTEDLTAARADAWDAASSVAWNAAWNAAWADAWAAAWDAAWAAAKDAAKDAAWAVERRWQGDRLALYISDSPIPPVAIDREAR